MMNLKETINFKALREKGVAALEIKNDEVVQIVGKNSEIKVVLTQEYFLKLLSAYNSILVESGHKKEKILSEGEVQKALSGLEERLTKLVKLSNEV